MRITGTHHIALVTSNFAQLRTFYLETLGLPQVGQFANRNIIFIEIGGTAIELVERGEAGATVTGGWDHLALEVEDTDAAYAELSGLGVPFHILPKDFPEEAPKVRIAFFKDPDGNILELVQALDTRYP